MHWNLPLLCSFQRKHLFAAQFTSGQSHAPPLSQSVLRSWSWSTLKQHPTPTLDKHQFGHQRMPSIHHYTLLCPTWNICEDAVHGLEFSVQYNHNQKTGEQTTGPRCQSAHVQLDQRLLNQLFSAGQAADLSHLWVHWEEISCEVLQRMVSEWRRCWFDGAVKNTEEVWRDAL